MLGIDFETFSEADIRRGAWRYAEDPTTDVNCMAWQIDNYPVYIWVPGDPLPLWVQSRIWDQGEIIEAHNAEFEKSIWRRVLMPKYGFPDIPDEHWQCSAAKAAAHSIPRSLEGASLVMRLKNKKDMEGKRVMMKLARPRKPTIKNPATRWFPKDAPQDYKVLYRYCMDDVRVETELTHSLRDLNATERRVWLLDQKINERGTRLDTDAIDGALKIIFEYELECNARVSKLTKGRLGGVTKLLEMREWMAEQGVHTDSLAKEVLESLLARDDLPAAVRELLQIRQSLSKTSTKKLQTMKEALCKDGRVRSLLMYHGASTGRWAGKGIQIHNFPRRKVDNQEELFKLIKTGDLPHLKDKHGDPMNTLSAALRGFIIPSDGYVLRVADYAAIEARGLAWLNRERSTLKEFHDNDAGIGDEPYCVMASEIFGHRVTKKEHPDKRDVGKASILGLGYGGGINAFSVIAPTYGIDLDVLAKSVWPTITDEEREKAEWVYEKFYKPRATDPLPEHIAIPCDVVKQRFRKKNPAAVQSWKDQEAAAIEALTTQKPVRCGRVLWGYMDHFLFCRLPSGRVLAYREPMMIVPKKRDAIDEVDEIVARLEAGPKLTYMTADSQKGSKWRRTYTYGGKLVENITQALARDIMAEAMLRVEDYGYRILFTVHDEVVAESSADFGSTEHYVDLLTELPEWAKGFPIKAEGWSGDRYAKR